MNMKHAAPATICRHPTSIASAPASYCKPSSRFPMCPPNTTLIEYEYLPSEVLGLIESFLPPSDCANISATSSTLNHRWTARRWQSTFLLHYGRKSQLKAKSRRKTLNESRKRIEQFRDLIVINGEEKYHNISVEERNAVRHYNDCYANEWESTFIGYCHDHRISCISHNHSSHSSVPFPDRKTGDIDPSKKQDHVNTSCNFNVKMYTEDLSDITTQFNVKALVPSIRRIYSDIWDAIELTLLGYYDSEIISIDDGYSNSHNNPHLTHNQFPVPVIMRLLRTSVIPELLEYLYFLVGFKPLAGRRFHSRTGSHEDHGNMRQRIRSDRGVMGPIYSRGLGGVQRLSLYRWRNRYNRTDSDEEESSSSLLWEVSRRKVNSTDEGITFERKENENYARQNPLFLHTTTAANSTLEDINRLRNTATTMSAWKLACILRERGVGCFRCAICDCIDLMGDDYEDTFSDDTVSMTHWNKGELEGYLHSPNSSLSLQARSMRRLSLFREFQKEIGGGPVWMTPCQCPELLHKHCLEKKLNLIPKCAPWEYAKRSFNCCWKKATRIHTALYLDLSHRNEDNENTQSHTCRDSSEHRSSSSLSVSSLGQYMSFQQHIAPRVWISYDNHFSPPRRLGAEASYAENEFIAVDNIGQFRSSTAMCDFCGKRYFRTVRLPRSPCEVLVVSLSDPLAMIRAASTFLHFLLACAFISACEGLCSDESCSLHRTLFTTPIGPLKWPTTGFNGFALAWWQLQQCCMLHIFFSRRFAAIVDRLWMGPISFFYFRLYFYFVVTSAILSASYIPIVSRTLRVHIMQPFTSTWILKGLQPVFSIIAVVNLLQYAILSTTVICIFWRTHYRIFTVADASEVAANSRQSETRAEREIPMERLGVQPRENDFPLDVIGHINNGRTLQRIIGVGAGDTSAASHPMYHGPW